MNNSDVVSHLIEKELERQRYGVELIASENFTSEAVMKATGSCLTNKYAEGYPNKRYYGGCEVVDEIEQLAIDRLNGLFNAKYSNVQPHSGAQANAAVFLSVLNPGDSILGFDLAHGGHLTHGSPVNFSGKVYKAHFYGVEPDTGRIDMDKVESIAKLVKPKLLICGASAYSREWDYARFREIANLVGALLLADISHPSGLIAGGILNNPLPHCHIVTSTTHKTLRGPRGGIIMMGENFDNPWKRTAKNGSFIKMSNILNGGVFPGMQGGPLQHVIAAKAIAFGEALEPSFKEYTKKVVDNSQAMAGAFMDRGYKIISDGTDNHLMLLDISNRGITGKLADEVLGRAFITVNKNMIPFDKQTPMITSGIRIGTAAITTRGFGVEDVLKVVDWIDDILSQPENNSIINNVKEEVNTYMGKFPLYPFIENN